MAEGRRMTAAQAVDKVMASEHVDVIRAAVAAVSYTRMLWMGLRKKAAYLPGC
jgi:hypothetical protein